jgi:hypothetical protein
VKFRISDFPRGKPRTGGLRICTILFVFVTCYSSLAIASEKWPGVDETVVEKYAKEHGREAHVPLINTDQGDLLLFVFLIAGAAGGFVAGYYWRMLMNEKTPATTRGKVN